MSVMTSLYPERLGLVTGSFELAASISSTVGPLLGGFVYQNHGFAVASAIPCKFLSTIFIQFDINCNNFEKAVTLKWIGGTG